MYAGNKKRGVFLGGGFVAHTTGGEDESHIMELLREKSTAETFYKRCEHSVVNC